MIDTSRDPQIVDLVTQAYSAAGPQERAGRWVMGRPWYDRLRAAACTEEQERMRAAAHANLMVSAAEPPPARCPACGAGPFADMRAFTGHVAAMADPQNREPDPRDQLFGIPIEVCEDGGEPHLASTQPISPFGI
jgi:hypothetical protein